MKEIQDLYGNQETLMDEMSEVLTSTQQEDFRQNVQMNQILTENEMIEKENIELKSQCHQVMA